MKNWKDLRCKVENEQLSPELSELVRALRTNDWNFARSDDMEVYYRGQKKTAALWARAQGLGPKGVALYNFYQEEAWKE